MARRPQSLQHILWRQLTPLLHITYVCTLLLLTAQLTLAECPCRGAADVACGANGVTFSSRCQAECDGHIIAHSGPCLVVVVKEQAGASDGAGPRLKALPALTRSGLPARVEVAACPFCNTYFNPVCGENGATYINHCQAICQGAAVGHAGSCNSNPGSKPPLSKKPPSSRPPPPRLSSSPAPKPARAPPPATEEAAVSCRLPSDACSACSAQALAPVCTTTGLTLPNKCFAACAQLRVASSGPCNATGPAAAPAGSTTAATGDCFCSSTYPHPTCTTTGSTAPYPCAATCAGLGLSYNGVCDLPGLAPPPAGDCSKCATASGGAACSASGLTMPSTCLARCAGVPLRTLGKCKQPQAFPAAPPPAASCRCSPADDTGPVCGMDGITHPSACSARCAGHRVLHLGPCRVPVADLPASPRVCACPATIDRVCGNDGLTYDNECMASCNSAAVASGGRCPAPAAMACSCPQSMPAQPVCGMDGTSYSSSCLASCANVLVAHTGACKKGERPQSCACGQVVAPVCGSNGATYMNACMARCLLQSVASASGSCVPAVQVLAAGNVCGGPLSWCGTGGACPGTRCQSGTCQPAGPAYWRCSKASSPPPPKPSASQGQGQGSSAGQAKRWPPPAASTARSPLHTIEEGTRAPGCSSSGKTTSQQQQQQQQPGAPPRKVLAAYEMCGGNQRPHCLLLANGDSGFCRDVAWPDRCCPTGFACRRQSGDYRQCLPA